MILTERWGGKGMIVVHGEAVDARNLPALIAGERKGLATYRIRRTNDIMFAEIITLDAITAEQGAGTAPDRSSCQYAANRESRLPAGNHD